MHALLANVFHVADIFSDSGYSIYLFLCFRFNNNHILWCIHFVMFSFLLSDTCLLCTVCAVLWVGGLDVHTMWAVHCLAVLVSWAHLCVSIMLDA